MEKILIPKPQFDCVYMINGVFSQNGIVKTAENKIIFLTVLPLSALLLSYTVKIVGQNVNCNKEFCKIYSIDQSTDIAVLKARNNFVYTPQRPHIPPQSPSGLFRAVKANKIDSARKLLSEDLNAAIDDDSLIRFFQDFCDIVPSSMENLNCDKYILCRNDGTAAYYKFIYKHGLIDDINEDS